MKINLTIGEPPINGYLNIDQEYDHDGKTKCPLDNINPFVDDNECEEILALDVLEYLPLSVANNALSHWVSKLAHGGKITVSGTNIRQVAKVILSKAADIDNINYLIFGEQKYSWQHKHSLIDIDRLSGALKSLGLNIIMKRIDGIKMYVTAERL